MSLANQLTLETVSFSKENQILIEWVSSINLPSCLEVTNFHSLAKGVALNDISSLILNSDLPGDIFRENIDCERKIKHNLSALLKSLAPVLPSHLSLITAAELMNSSEKLFVLLRWMVKVLDFPFYKKLKASFGRFYSKGVEITKQEIEKLKKGNTKSLENMKKSPEVKPKAKEQSKWKVRGVDVYSLLRKMNVPTGKNEEEFLYMCKTGETIANLINIIEGRQEKLRGITKKPLWKTYKSANISKILKFLRSFEKMSSTYLWSEKEILEGDVKTIKGLIYDILLLYKKLPKKEETMKKNEINFTSPNFNQNSPLLTVVSRGPNFIKKRNSLTEEIAENLTESIPERPVDLGEQTKERIVEWLTMLELRHYIISSKDIFTDSLRNGLILCELAGMISHKKNIQKFNPPKSIFEACENIEAAFNVFIEKNKGIPLSFLKNPIKIARGENNAIWGLLYHIMLSYPNLTNSSKKYSLKELPYNSFEIKRLQESLVEFVLSKGVVDRSRVPLTFQEILPEITSGVLLSDLVSRVLEKPIPGVFRAQISETLALSNIKKSLEPLRYLRKMGQKYLFSEEDILKGNLGVILGLLEDLHRFSDNIPPRQRGKNYHSDGPYFGRSAKKNEIPLKNSFTLSSDLLEEYENVPKRMASSQSTAVLKKSQEGFLKLEKNDEFEWITWINVKVPRGLDFSSEEILDFKNGMLLAEIVGILERKKIEGICEKGGKAACLHNIEKVFAILRQKPSFPSYLCFCEDEIYRGIGDIVRAVLREIHKVYRTTIASMKSFNLR